MFRYLILPSLLAVLLIPDWASAFFRRRSATNPVAMPVRPVQYCPPVYPQPLPCPPMFAPAPAVCCPPAAVTSSTPKVVPERMATPKATTPETPTPVTPKVERPVEPVVPRIPNEESQLPTPRPVEPKAIVPAPPITPVVGGNDNIPPIGVPPTPPALPKLSFPPAGEPRLEPTVPERTPNPAPKSDTGGLPKMELPSLDNPPLAVPKAVEVKSSPLSGGRKELPYELFPVAGAVSGLDAKRAVTFHNFSGRDLLLTIDGKTVTLPAKHTLAGTVGEKFKLQIGAREEFEVTVPAGAPGAEVVLRK